MLTRGARRLFQLLNRLFHKYGVCFPSQAWIAGKLKASRRSVQYWTAELIRGKFVAQKRRAQRSAMYIVLRELPAKVAPHIAPRIAPHLIGGMGSNSFRERKPPGRALSLESQLAELMPAEYLETPGGRRYINPSFVKTRDALIDAMRSGRLYKARDPFRYGKTIIEREAIA